MDKRIWKLFLVFVLFSFLLSGCNYFAARDQIRATENLIAELKAQGGEKLVPYEYTSAEKFLEVSKMEFNENDYKHAKGFADRAKSAAETGLAEVKKK
jgi:hypothetical protein